jgi:hypothetical protein
LPAGDTDCTAGQGPSAGWPGTALDHAIPPPLSVAKAKFFKENPEAWSKFLAQLPRRPATVPQATAQSVPQPSGGTWTAVTTAPIGLSNPLLLTDGIVIAHESESETWYKLTPDNTGSYAAGTWTQIASLPSGYGPLYFASAVLPDGRVIIQGGEYNKTCTTGGDGIWTNLGAIYDPVANSWTPVYPPSGSGWTNTEACGTEEANGGIGDAAGILLHWRRRGSSRLHPAIPGSAAQAELR